MLRRSFVQMLSGCAALLGLSKGSTLSKERKDKPCAISFVPSSEIVVVRIQSVKSSIGPPCHAFVVEGKRAEEFCTLVFYEHCKRLGIEIPDNPIIRRLMLFIGDEGLEKGREIYENASVLYDGSVEFITMPEKSI